MAESENVVSERIDPLEESFHELDRKLCPTCGKSFASQKSLNVHMKIHNENHGYKCKERGCCKKYCKKVDLENHLRSKHGAKKMECQNCHKSFANKQVFKRHTEGCGKMEKPGKHYTCHVCGLKFSRICDVRYHIRAKHDNASVFKCQKCGKNYRWRSSLGYHKKRCTD